jgi:hypothetical protein
MKLSDGLKPSVLAGTIGILIARRLIMNKKVEFLNRLFQMMDCKTAMLQHLKEDKLINQDSINAILKSHESAHCSNIHRILTDLHKESKLQLLDYEWKILPYEHLKLTIISHSGIKEFEYSDV